MKHNLFMVWVTMVWLVVSASAQNTQQVTAVQYYYDTDPGAGIAGNGAIVSVTPAASINQTFSFTVPNTLANGFHNLYVRAQDEHGRWSLTERRLFIIQTVTGTEDITAYQYYFDADPGVNVAGNGAIVPVPQTANYSATVAITVPNTLTNGFHNLYVRVRDVSGQWSLTERRLFIIQTVTGTEDITAYQYYFDADPGVNVAGNGAIVPVPQTANYSATAAITVPNTLTNGFHNLYVRVRDVSGQWSLTERRLFIIQTVTGTEDITAYQYYFDADPGVNVAGNGAIVPVAQTANYSATAAITVPNTLTNGFHNLYVRVRDVSGQWSLTERRLFIIQNVTGTENVTALEYYFDADPGVGNGNPYPITSTADFTATIDLGVPCLSTGTHYLYVRAKNVSGRWSIIGRDTLTITSGIAAAEVTPSGPINICSNSSVTLSFTPVAGVSYQWLLEGTDISGATGSSYVVTAAGNYSLKSTCGSSFITSNVVYVTTLPLITYFADADDDGYGDVNIDSLDCTQPVGFVANSDDCDDNDPDIKPGAPETCNGVDDNCDGFIDEGVELTFYADADGDNFGDPDVTTLACAAPVGYVANSDDCDDADPFINPAATEICNLIDDDCDGYIDEDVKTTFYVDVDEDGYGDPLETILACTVPAGYVSNNSDCDDSDINIYPGAIEACNGIDDNCDGNIDEGFIYSVEATEISSSNEESFCEGGSTTLAVNGGTLGTGAIWMWYESNCDSGTSIGTGNSLSLTPSAGTHTYFVRAEGTCNNSDCVFIEITVNTPPTFTSCPDNVSHSNDVSLCSATIDYSVLTEGNPAPSFLYTFTGATTGSGSGTGSGSSFNKGLTNVTIDATNICGSVSCSFTVTIDDLEGPSIFGCPDPITLETEEGQWGSHVSWTEPTSTDNCDLSSFTSSHAPGDFFNVGSTIVSYTATDQDGNETTCQYYVTVTPPDLVGKVNVSVLSSDITFSENNPDISSTVSVSAVIRNNSNIDAGSFVVQMKEVFSNTTYPSQTISGLNAGQSIVVNDLIATPIIPAFVPIEVTIDLLDGLDESNELDNLAVRPFICGSLETPGTMGVSTNAVPASVPAGSVIQICGSAFYENVSPPLLDPSVAGAELVITIIETGQQINGFTNEDGNFCYSYTTSNTPGLYHYTVDITDNTLGGDQSGTFTLSAPVYVCPTDLSVSIDLTGISTYTNSFPVGTSFSGTVHVHNSCEAISQATTLFIGLPSGSPVPGPHVIPALSPGETYDVPLPSITMSTVGSFYISATVDYYNIIVESDESNNTAYKSLIVLPLLPDIAVSGENILYGLQCEVNNQVSFTIKNIGTVSTGSFTTDYNIYVNGTLTSTVSQQVSSLDPNEYQILSYPFITPATSDIYTFELIVDDPDLVTELSELNNQSDFSRIFQPCLADIVLLGCEYTDIKPADPASPDIFTVSATIRNYGQLPVTSPFTVDFNVAGNIISVPVAGPLGAQQSLTLSVDAPVPMEQCGLLTVTADADNEVTEQNENNNQYSASLCYEFVFEQLDCFGDPIFKGTQQYCNPANLQIGYWNHAIYEASNFQVKFEISGPGLTGWVDLGTFSKYAGNSCGCPGAISMPNTFYYPETGTYQVRMTADPNNIYPELDEINNELILSVNVVESADYKVLSSFISPSDINPEINEEISFNVSYSNVGCAGFNPIELYTQVDNTALYSTFVDALPGGGMITIPIPTLWSSAVPGIHVFRAIIDHTDLIDEVDEMNNEATKAIVVGEAPDYHVTSVSSSDMTPVMGQLLTLTSSILNEGQSMGSGLLQFIYSNAQGIESVISERTISVAPGNTVIESTSWITSDVHARIIARVINVMPLEFDFSDNEKQIQLNDMSVTLSSVDVLCFGESNGEVTVDISGGIAPFIIEWDNPTLSGQIINVPDGQYTVTVTDFYGLSATESIIVSEPNSLTLMETHVDASCDNLSDGSIDLTVEGGITPYTYSWSNGPESQDISSLGAGTYEVTVTDYNNCTAGTTITITNLSDATIWYKDMDTDTYGNINSTTMSCIQPVGYVSDNSDCNDNEASINPGADEICGNNIDDNCDGYIDEGCCDITVNAGDDVTTFFGITSMQQVDRTAIVGGGTAPFTFSWTLGRPLLCNHVNEEGDESFYGGTCTNNSCPESGSPEEAASCSGSATVTAVLLDTTNICVTVTDANGCTASDCFTVYASDARCFAGNSGNHKVKICHHTNSPNNPWVEICVDTNSLTTHLGHGDYIGSCVDESYVAAHPANEDDIESSVIYNTNELDDEDFTLNLRLFPNPARELVTLEFNGLGDKSYVIDIMDITGRKLAGFKGRANSGKNTREMSVVNMASGIYLVKLVLDDKQEVKKLVRE